jgi:hypothetical protein
MGVSSLDEISQETDIEGAGQIAPELSPPPLPPQKEETAPRPQKRDNDPPPESEFLRMFPGARA